ncbi:MAG TPA: trypsin-like peptidase domain-containing protein [Chthoniobacterales bacterium]|jgi:S1-C subfamily serine protease|nr:trypsin-like peptidase domain-containing protein [Chthoniobacterales bacterium]
MEFWVHRNGQYAGRFAEPIIREKVADGSFSRGDLVWDESKSAWQPISEFLDQQKAPATSSAEKIAEENPVAAAGPESPLSVPAKAGPPPLPVVTSVPAAGPPPLPVLSSAGAIPPAAPPAGRPPEGETISSPYVAILWSFFLSPAFGGFIVWRNWLTMNRRRRAMMAAPWFWIGFLVVALAFYAPNTVTLLIWIGYVLAWIAFSAFPQIRYVHTTYKRERMRSGLPLLAGFVLSIIGFTAFHFASPSQKPALGPGPQAPIIATTQLSQSHDRVFTPDELRDIYKSSVLEVRATWNERRSFNKKDNGANGTGVLLYNDAEYGLVATNWHVVEPSEGMTGDYKCGVRFSHDKEFADCLVVAKGKNDIDLALLLVRLDGTWAPNQFPVRALDQIKEGEACIAIGNALGEGLSITAGIISKFDKVKDQTLIRTSTPVSPGNSGGPLILCRGGSLAGIVTLQSRITNVQNVNFATPAQYLLDKNIWEFESEQDEAQKLLDKAIAQATAK